MKVRYTGEDQRIYPSLFPDVVNPGDVLDLDEMPDDGRWIDAADIPQPEPPAPEPPAATDVAGTDG
jgi:hypothetical protein